MPHDRRDVKTNFDPFAIRFRDDRRNRYNRFNPAVETPIPRLTPPSFARSTRRSKTADFV